MDDFQRILLLELRSSSSAEDIFAMAAVATKAASGFMQSLKRWAYYTSGFNKYGLYRDDLLFESPDVEEALKRMPQDMLDARNYRIIRASQCSMTKTILPKEDWTKYEDDLQNRQLWAMVEQVKKEREEREIWESKY